MTEKLTPNAIDAALAPYSDWNKNDYESVTKRFVFTDFEETMAFANACADIARHHDHHPVMLIEYGSVIVTLSTHDAGGVTERDIRFIEALEAAARNSPSV